MRVTFDHTKRDQPNNNAPFNGLTPAQFLNLVNNRFKQVGGSVGEFVNPETNQATITRCDPIPATEQPPSTPPAVTPEPEQPVETQEYDGDPKDTTPQPPPKDQIVLRGRPIADIAAGSMGFCQLEFSRSFLGSDCKKLSPNPISTSKSTEGLAADCSKAKDGNLMFFALNPGATTIEKGTQIVAVRDYVGEQGSVTTATIVVVPCST
tara:strand:+ start:266 stop:889 length:624 start_codon:yes stop_codon:yes gene_type:complete